MPYPEIEIVVKYRNRGRRLKPIKMDCATNAIKVIKNVCNKKEIVWIEECLMFCLNNDLDLIGWYRVSKGGTTFTSVDIKVIATIALSCTASNIILAHNHPSGNTNPSAGDLALTAKVTQGLRLLDIELLDHIIFSDNDYLSMRDNGYFENK